ncbi:1-aminocyclopropane-1-carboxylate deaminase/D-cysteine desulfhydrase [Flavobacterium sp. F-328]|uniref:1-aminocyclopropane-1-carboxylate deaminase/D-cysteine desulfhydrase n=1 Tax=Flavobacterium erciyesense TaxID=2825842 RepID=A0ABS5D1P1_9FLAO|nr:pyridoxal-phosphate dependent enzyme [Flavobacterium erciyesense]MBQ0907910.1 1-aminocyclopropane-1-carboxylate deaminase/D-cysteine desulfhydrase [Flavobacterium erciyesense]
MNQILPQLFSNNCTIAIKREDLLHPFVSGNKFRKLKYNLQQAKKEQHHTLLTFGGAFSNHIAAIAYAGKANGFKTIGVIRGEELIDKISDNPTLLFAQECGMQFHFVTRSQYREKENPAFLEDLQSQFGWFYTIPEGGTNALAIKGCQEVLTQDDVEYDFICCAVGTGGTISGIIASTKPSQKVLGFPALKGDFLSNEIRNFVNQDNWELITEYHFGGYGKVNLELVKFINEFYSKFKIPLDPIYTGKTVYGVFDLIEKNYFPENSKILIVHSGGLQGIAGMNLKLKNKQLPTIDVHV